MIYFTCGDWTPPPQDSPSEATDENQGQYEDINVQNESNEFEEISHVDNDTDHDEDGQREDAAAGDLDMDRVDE